MTAFVPRLSLLLLLVAACAIGTGVSTYQPAQGPAGASLKLELSGKRRIEGELLAVEAATLLVRRSNELVRVPLAIIENGDAPKMSFRGRSLTAEDRESLRLVSRYPQGVTPELEAHLLEAYHQQAVQEIS